MRGSRLFKGFCSAPVATDLVLLSSDKRDFQLSLFKLCCDSITYCVVTINVHFNSAFQLALQQLK